MPRLNASQFAKLVGVSEAVVRKGLKSGRIAKGADGLIDSESQAARWDANRDPSKIRPGFQTRPATVSTPEASSRATASFEQLKSGKTALEIQLLQEELKKVRLQTINRDETRRALSAFSRLLRDKTLNFPNRFGQQIAAEVGCDAKALMAALDKSIRLHLEEVSNSKATLPE